METRTNIILNDELVDRAMAKAGVKTKKAAIEAALRAYVKAPDWAGLLALSGSGALADDYDPKQLFSGDRGLRLASEPPAAHHVDRRVDRNAVGGAAEVPPASGDKPPTRRRAATRQKRVIG